MSLTEYPDFQEFDYIFSNATTVPKIVSQQEFPALFQRAHATLHCIGVISQQVSAVVRH
jgi:hypothetical protein